MSCLALAAMWLSLAGAAQKLKDSDCLTCHGDSTLTTDENGKQVSLLCRSKTS